MKKIIFIYAAIAVLALYAAITFQSVQSVATSKDYHMYEQEKNNTLEKLNLNKDKLIDLVESVIDYTKGGNDTYYKSYFNGSDQESLTFLRLRYVTLNQYKYMAFTVFFIMFLFLCFKYKRNGLKAFGIVFIGIGALLTVLTWIFMAAGIFGTGMDNLLIKYFVPDIKAFIDSNSPLSVFYPLKFFTDAGYRLIRYIAVASVFISMISLVFIFYKKNDENTNDNYLYQ